jgi:hypothetical protein
MKRLDIRWTKHLPEEQRPGFEKMVRNSGLLLNRLEAIIAEEETLLYREIVSPDFNTDWSGKHAFQLGRLNQLKKLKDLISLEKE